MELDQESEKHGDNPGQAKLDAVAEGGVGLPSATIQPAIWVSGYALQIVLLSEYQPFSLEKPLAMSDNPRRDSNSKKNPDESGLF